MKDILYITLKVQAAQNVSIQNDLKKKFYYFFTINGLAKTGLLPPALFTEYVQSIKSGMLVI